ncbi:MAG: DUF2911 domain-containing protein [Bacteroidota bacterium]
MSANYTVKFLLVIMVGLMSSFLLKAQDGPHRNLTPYAKATGKIGDASIVIDYSSPFVKGRKIFGGLLPYGKLWRAGANEATIFQTDKDLTIDGKKLPAGKYSFFATPGETEWTIFFNSETGQYGSKDGGDTNMDPAKTVMSFTVKPKKRSDLKEKMEYTITNNGFSLQWEYTNVFIKAK